MSGDDYSLYANYHQDGFWATQRLVYNQWTGRFTSTALGTLFMKFGLPDRYYFLHTLLLFVLSWSAILFLVVTVNRNWLAGAFTTSMLALASSIFLLVTIYVQAEIATGFYWFSSAITYQTAFIFFILLAACLIRRFYNPDTRRQRLYNGMIFLCILLINGSNEVAAVFLALFLAMLIVAAYYYRRTIPPILIVYFVSSLVIGMIVLFTSGILSGRHAFINKNSNTAVVMVLPMILFRVATVFYYILKVPLFWITCALLHMTGRRIADDPAILSTLAPWKDRKILLPGLVTLAILILLTLTMVLLVSKGSLPDRALNNLVDLGALFLLTISFIAGAVNATGTQPRPSVMLPPTAFVIILVAGLIAADPFVDAWKSAFSGYFYHSVQVDRRQKMLDAQKNQQRTVNLEQYEEALSEKIHRVFPNGIFSTVNTLLREKPALLFQEQGLDIPDPGWPNYYKLDSVTIGKH